MGHAFLNISKQIRENLWASASCFLWLGLALVGLGACSGGTSAPTLVPTLLPVDALVTTPLPTLAPAPSPTAGQPATSQAGEAVAYTVDPLSGEMLAWETRPNDSGVVRVSLPEDRLWVVNENVMIAYRPVALDETEGLSQTWGLAPVQMITYTYDLAGRRTGWTVTWPQGPTPTQELRYLYEGLLLVGERLKVGGVVTTTYYPWATRDRASGLEAGAALSAGLPISDVTRYDPVCQATREMDCLDLLAAIIVSEASVGTEVEQRAVAWTARNRLDRGLSLHSYAYEDAPSDGYVEMARQVLTAPPESDLTNGATHFFSPRSMPLQGEESRCKQGGGIYDCQGGLVYVEGLDQPAYAPFWHLTYQWLPVPGVRKTHFLFYRIPPLQPRVGE